MAKKSADTGEGGSPKKKRGLMALVKAVAFVSIIVLIEIAAASMLLPDANETRKIGETLANAVVGEDGEPVEAEDAEEAFLDLEDSREVNLGEFHVLTYDADTGASMTIDFELYGVVLDDEADQFFELFNGNQQRISEQVNITMRGMDASDFADPGLGLIRRKILEKVNRALGSPLLQKVVFPKFSYLER